jgi:predicted pyridoxine 5'-phosphate oxidase superfamily flavin-nucleotide-binding protein
MVKLPEKAMELFNDLQAMKVIATVDATGKPHITPKGSMMAIDDETIAYSEMAGGKTKANLEATKQAAVLACKELKAWKVRGVLGGIYTSGDVFEQFKKTAKEKFGLDVNNVVTLKVEEVYTGGGKQIA